MLINWIRIEDRIPPLMTRVLVTVHKCNQYITGIDYLVRKSDKGPVFEIYKTDVVAWCGLSDIAPYNPDDDAEFKFGLSTNNEELYNGVQEYVREYNERNDIHPIAITETTSYDNGDSYSITLDVDGINKSLDNDAE